MKKILIIAAHPDDEILGCGGTALRLAKEGNEIYTMILGEGITSRDDVRNSEIHKNELSSLRSDLESANKVIGAKDVFVETFPDNRFDSVPLLDIVKSIEKIKNKIKPDMVFTHFANDMNIDHTITNRAVLTATRPMVDETVKTIYAFEVLSSTEWNFPLSFNPDTFFDISDFIEGKKEAMSLYKNEIREFPHPRSVKGIELNSAYWGMRVGLNFAEAFVTLRNIL